MLAVCLSVSIACTILYAINSIPVIFFNPVLLCNDKLKYHEMFSKV